MSKRPIGAITFDLWDCLFCDDSDEAKRAAAGVPPKSVARRDLVYAALERNGGVAQETAHLAFDMTDAAFRKVWRDLHVTWSVRDRMAVLLDGLGRELPPAGLEELVAQLEGMELAYRPDPVPGAVEALAKLHEHYRLAVISDTVFSPGAALRQLLEGAGMLPHFDHLVFSDELGRSKPHPAVFQSVAEAFDVPVEHIVHIGDRPHNDVGGARAVGARCVLLTAVKQRPLEGHAPDAVCHDYADLPAIVGALDA